MTEVIGVALIGAAHSTHAWSYAKALTESASAHVVGIHDDRPEQTLGIRQDFGVPFVEDARQLLQSPDVQAAVVCTPTAAHRGSVELAASLRKHVLCEKPIATTREDADAMVSACASAGVQLHMAFVSRFLPIIGRARELIRAGRVGDVVGLVGGNRGRPPLPPEYPEWITAPSEAGGGALIDHSVHVTDAMRHVTGLEVTRVSAEAGALLWDLDVDDVAILTLGFDNRAVGSIDPSWSVPADHPWDYDFYLRVLGTEGSLDISDDAEAVNVVSTRAGGPRGLRQQSFADDADQRMIEAFVLSIATDRPAFPSASGADGVKALQVALAGYESAATGSVVELT